MSSPRSALVIAPLAEEHATLERVLGEFGYECVHAVTTEAMTRAAMFGRFDVVVVGTDAAPDRHLLLARLRIAPGTKGAFVLLVAPAPSARDLESLAAGEASDVLVDACAEPVLRARLTVIERRAREDRAREDCAREDRARDPGGAQQADTRAEIARVLGRLDDTFLVVNPDAEVVFSNRPALMALVEGTPRLKAYELAASERSAMLRERLDHVFATGASVEYDYETVGAWFAVRLLHDGGTGADARVLIIYSDVTGRRSAERALRDSEARAQALLDALPDLYFRIDRSGQHLAYRAEHRNELFVPPERIVGQTVRDLLPPDVAGMIMQGIEGALATGEVQVLEYPLTVPRGREHYEARIVATGADEVVMLVRNITARVENEAWLRARDRTTSVATLVAGVAHEVNNPLGYMTLSTRMVARELDALATAGKIDAETAERWRAALRVTLEGAERVRAVVADLKTIGQADKEVLGPVDVHVSLEAALNLAAPEIARRARVTRRFGEVPYVRGNDKLLGQLFLNLLTNAAQAIPADAPEAHEIRIATVASEDGRCLIEVGDTGEGIPPERLERIFDPFFTTKPPGVGVGLGLWVCQRVVVALGGKIDVTSEVGKGAVFRVTLEPAFAAR